MSLFLKNPRHTSSYERITLRDMSPGVRIWDLEGASCLMVANLLFEDSMISLCDGELSVDDEDNVGDGGVGITGGGSGEEGERDGGVDRGDGVHREDGVGRDGEVDTALPLLLV